MTMQELILASSREHFIKKVPCSVNLKVNNATKTRRFIGVELRTLAIFSLKFFIQKSKSDSRFHSFFFSRK
jgi:hypothetical protein